MKSKKCTECKIDKNTSEYFYMKKGQNRLQETCKKCCRAYNKENSGQCVDLVY